MLDISKLIDNKNETKTIELEQLKKERDDLDDYTVQIKKLSYADLRKAAIMTQNIKLNIPAKGMDNKQQLEKAMEKLIIPVDMAKQTENHIKSVLFICSKGLVIDGETFSEKKIDEMFSDRVKTELHDKIVEYSGGELEEAEEFREGEQDRND